MKPKLTIISGGTGGEADLTARARQALAAARRVYAAERLAAAFSGLRSDIAPAGPAQIRRALREQPDDMAVIVSGDGLFYSLGGALCREFADCYEIELLPGISSLQAVCARLRIPWNEVETLSVHGRAPDALISAVSYNRYVFALTGGENGPGALLQLLCEAGLGHVTAHVGEELGGGEERICSGPAGELCRGSFREPAVLLLEHPGAADPSARLRDGDFIRAQVPMTKEPVRALALSMLSPGPEDCVWDVGAGTGALSVVLAWAARRGRVYAVECGEAAQELIRRNRERLGAYNITLVAGRAPAALAVLPAPDKVFVGGSGGALRAIVQAARAKNPGVYILAPACTLETLREASELIREPDFSQVEIECVQSSRAVRAGRYNRMAADNPVYLIGGRGRP